MSAAREKDGDYQALVAWAPCVIGNDMIAEIKDLLLGRVEAGKGLRRGRGSDELPVAAAALLLEIARTDGHVDEAERETIARLLEARFGLDADEVKALIEAGQKAAARSSQLYGFTRIIKDRFNDEARIRMIEMLWEVAYADGQIHDYESSLVRRIAGLIYVPDRESGAARKRVLARHKKAAAKPPQ